MIKSFRGKIASGSIATIRLSTNNGLMGYKINKFELFPIAPGQGSAADIEATVKVFSIEPSTADGNVNFDDPTLLAAGYLVDSNSVANTTQMISIFDNMKFNQDIYVTSFETNAVAVNYYIELEQVKLSVDEATVATLKDMRGRE